MLIKFPPSLSEYHERYLRGHITDWCLANGMVLMDVKNEGQARAVPVTMYPTPFSRHGFDTALHLQTAFNSLYHAVVCNPEFIVDALRAATPESDAFTASLLAIHSRTAPHRTQHLTGGVFRSDYLVDKVRTSIDEGRQIKQVEFNTMAASFAGLASRVTQMHRFIAESGRSSVHGEVPLSTSLRDVAAGIAAMHHAYGHGAHGAQQGSVQQGNGSAGGGSGSGVGANAVADDESSTISSTGAQTVVLFVVQPKETNIADQRLLEYELYARHGVLSVRATLEQISRKTTIGEHNRLIFVPLGCEVSVVYYRAGYAPTDYASETEWAVREHLESSHAIQCPSVLTQLAGAKKIQQLLTAPGVIEQLLKKSNVAMDAKQLAQLRKTFVGMWPLDSESELGREGQELAFAEPDRFVLKPQREGGGNNIYKDDIPAFLESIDRASWANYILMELIEPPKVSNKILRGADVVSGRIVSELGIFGTVLWDLQSGKELQNTVAGFLLRTKLQSSNEGGIAAGFGCLDAVLLPSR